MEEASKKLDQKFDKEVRKEFSRINSAFGSSLGFKLNSELISEIEASGDDKLKRQIGFNVQQDYSEDALLGLSEDSSENIYKLKSIKNAFPTFRLYLIEEDEIYTDRLTAFDDFFYYNSVISFNVHNSRELAASIATIQLQNISGILDGTKKKVLRDVDLDPNTREDEMREEGNFIDSIVLRPGVTVQLRAGYESNTNNLDILISGKITDINYAQSNTICNITVQSFGNELTALRKGNGNKDNNEASVFYSTHQLLGSMMMSDELKHFGRSKVGAVFQVGEYKDYSLDLDLYKKESSFNMSLSRNFFDWVRDNTWGIGIGVGLLTLGGPALKLAGRTKWMQGITSWYKGGTGWGAVATRGTGNFLHGFAIKPFSWINPFGGNKRAQDLIIQQARALSDRIARSSTMSPLRMQLSGLAPTISTFDDAVEYLIRANGLNLSAGSSVALDLVQTTLKNSGGLAHLLSGSGLGAGRIFANLPSNIVAHGYLQGSVAYLFKKVANVLPFVNMRAGSELGEEFFKQIVLKHKGFTALGLNGMAPSGMRKAWMATRMGADIIFRSYASVRLPLMIGGGGAAISLLLSGIDVAVDSLKYLYYSIIGKFSEDLDKPVEVYAHKFSENAVSKIEKSGGKANII